MDIFYSFVCLNCKSTTTAFVASSPNLLMLAAYAAVANFYIALDEAVVLNKLDLRLIQRLLLLSAFTMLASLLLINGMADDITRKEQLADQNLAACEVLQASLTARLQTADERHALLVESFATARVQFAKDEKTYKNTITELQAHVRTLTNDIRTKESKLAQVLAERNRLNEGVADCREDLDECNNEQSLQKEKNMNASIVLKKHIRRVQYLEEQRLQCSNHTSGLGADPNELSLAVIGRQVGSLLYRLVSEALFPAKEEEIDIEEHLRNPLKLPEPFVIEAPIHHNITTSTHKYAIAAHIPGCDGNLACDTIKWQWLFDKTVLNKTLGQSSNKLLLISAPAGKHDLLITAVDSVTNTKAEQSITVQVRHHLIVGIDLGTTYSCIAYAEATGAGQHTPVAIVAEPDFKQLCMPSHISLRPSGGILFGTAAKEAAANKAGM